MFGKSLFSVKKSIITIFCLFVSGKRNGAVLLLLLLFQEPLKKKGCLFQEPLAACFKNRSKKWFFSSSACFKNRSSSVASKNSKKRSRRKTRNFLFICFNGSFLNRRTPLLERKKKNRSKKGLFPKEVEEKRETFVFLFQEKKGLFQEQAGLPLAAAQRIKLFGARRKEDNGIVSRKRRNTKQEDNYLFQEKEETQSDK